MSNSEIILYIITGLFTAKEIWLTVRNYKNKKTQVQLAQINSDHEAIETIKANYHELKSKYRMMNKNYKELKISFSVMLPALEKLVEDDPTLKASFEVMTKYFLEED